MITDPKVLGLAFLSGVVPAFFWLWFWLKEDKKNPEPKGLLTMVFIVGMATVVLVLPAQKMIQNFSLPYNYELITWASIEEVMKFILALIVIGGTGHAEEPTDWPIYLITLALGFAALENMLFLIKPFSVGQTAVGLLTGQLRFLGSTLLHTIASAIIGISMGLSFYLDGFTKKIYLLMGIAMAIALHSAFNFFIIRSEGDSVLQVLAFLWVGAIIVMLLFEKLRRMSPTIRVN